MKNGDLLPLSTPAARLVFSEQSNSPEFVLCFSPLLVKMLKIRMKRKNGGFFEVKEYQYPQLLICFSILLKTRGVDGFFLLTASGFWRSG